MTQPLYDRLGGGIAVTAVANALYARIAGDPALAPFFAGTPIERQTQRMCLFLAQATGGPAKYDGPPLNQVHARFHITNEQFDRVATHLVNVLTDLEVGQTEISEAEALAETTRAAIVAPATPTPSPTWLAQLLNRRRAR